MEDNREKDRILIDNVVPVGQKTQPKEYPTAPIGQGQEVVANDNRDDFSLTNNPKINVVSSSSAQKRNFKGLVVPAIVVLALFVVGLGVHYFLLTQADKKSDEYRTRAISYLKQVYTNLDVKTTDEVRTAISKEARPTLESVVLGDVVSSNYANSKKLSDSISSEIDKLQLKLDEILAVYDFEKTALSEVANMQQVDSNSGVEALNEILEGFKAIKQSVEDNTNKAPIELRESFESLSVDYDEVVKATESLIEAYNSGDSNKLLAAYEVYTDIVTELSSSKSTETISSYYNSLPATYDEIRSDFKDYVESIN